ncbi:GyrI-like domain-containing protein [Marinomonas gallaica]|uniref:GyrI-like domain-containing protein n=1 Tax=Marinomonas gallaica TaxID=1806667 RepID=UPI003A8E7C49
MQIVNVEEFTVSGVQVRTKNADEMNADSAKIGGLWQKFGSSITPKLTSDSIVYGVYCHYESDANGEFDVYAGSNVVTDLDGLESVTVHAGEYMVFSQKGDMPQSVINAWVEIWQYFSELPERERAYTTDFECYKSDDEVEVYIALK